MKYDERRHSCRWNRSISSNLALAQAFSAGVIAITNSGDLSHSV